MDDEQTLTYATKNLRRPDKISERVVIFKVQAQNQKGRRLTMLHQIGNK